MGIEYVTHIRQYGRGPISARWGRGAERAVWNFIVGRTGPLVVCLYYTSSHEQHQTPSVMAPSSSVVVSLLLRGL